MGDDDIPQMKRYGRGDRLYVQAQRIWMIVAAFAMYRPDGRKTITYGDVAEAMGLDRRAGHTLGRQLGIIAKYCILNDLPALNAIVVAEKTGVPGDEVMLRESKTIQQEQAAVLKVDWFSIRLPSTGTLRKVWEAYFSA